MQSNRPITSREYKLILSAPALTDRAATIREIWTFLQAGAAGVLEEQMTWRRRWTSYLDTPDRSLRAAGFSLRLRRDDEGKRPYKLTLKQRSPDRYLAAAAPTDSPKKRAEPKFEEDLLPPFASRFSRSTSIRRKSDPELTRTGDLAPFFPDLQPEPSPLEVVSGLRAREVVLWLGRLHFGDADRTEVKTCMSFWFADEAEQGAPLVGELSFDYDGGEPAEVFPLEVVRGCHRLFRSLQEQPWFDPEGTTKTAFAYGARPERGRLPP